MLSAGNILPAPFKRVTGAAHSALRRVRARAAVRFGEIDGRWCTHSNMATDLILHP